MSPDTPITNSPIIACASSGMEPASCAIHQAVPALLRARATVLLTPSLADLLGAMRWLQVDCVIGCLDHSDNDAMQLYARVRDARAVPVVGLASPEASPDGWPADIRVIRLPFAVGGDDGNTAAAEVLRLALVERRSAPSDARSLSIDFLGRRLSVNGTDVPLTPLEFDVMSELLARRGEVVTTRDLAERVWGYQTEGPRNYIETRISRLRSKLRKAGSTVPIENVRGVGYVVR